MWGVAAWGEALAPACPGLDATRGAAASAPEGSFWPFRQGFAEGEACGGRGSGERSREVVAVSRRG